MEIKQLARIFCGSYYSHTLECDANVCQVASCLWVGKSCWYLAWHLMYRKANQSKTFLYKFLTFPKETGSIILEKNPLEFLPRDNNLALGWLRNRSGWGSSHVHILFNSLSQPTVHPVPDSVWIQILMSSPAVLLWPSPKPTLDINWVVSSFKFVFASTIHNFVGVFGALVTFHIFIKIYF